MTDELKPQMPEEIYALLANAKGIIIISNAPAATRYIRADLVTRPEWRVIGNCPKNRGVPIIMIDVEGVIDIGWWNDHFKNRDGYIIEPTHWQPLPEPPKEI